MMNDPYFNFRECYVKGDTLYYTYINELMNKREILKLNIRTIYPKVLIAQDENGQCYTISSEDKDRIFSSKEEAQIYLKVGKEVNK